jgi:hypothetical protein
MMLLSNDTYGHEIGFAMDEQSGSSERVCIVAIHHYKLRHSRNTFAKIS